MRARPLRVRSRRVENLGNGENANIALMGRRTDRKRRKKETGLGSSSVGVVAIRRSGEVEFSADVDEMASTFSFSDCVGLSQENRRFAEGEAFSISGVASVDMVGTTGERGAERNAYGSPKYLNHAIYAAAVRRVDILQPGRAAYMIYIYSQGPLT